MSSKCKICDQAIKNVRAPGALCGGACGKVFHVKCAGISDILYNDLKNGSASWICTSCRPESRKSIVVPDDDSDIDILLRNKSPELKDVLLMLAKVYKKITDIESSQNFVCSKIDECNQQINNLISENSMLSAKVAVLERKAVRYESKLNALEANLDKQNQNLIENDIIIKGFPEKCDNYQQIIMKCFSLINSNVPADDIASIKQISLKSKANLPESSFYIVSLKSKQIKQNILNSFRKKRKLFIHELDEQFSESFRNQRIHIMHRFTKLQSALYKEAKQIKADFNFAFLWVKDGQILLRKDDKSNVCFINSFNDIDMLRINSRVFVPPQSQQLQLS